MKKRKLVVRENFETGVNIGNSSGGMRDNGGWEEREKVYIVRLVGGCQREKVGGVNVISLLILL
jgi:hypothetical protein